MMEAEWESFESEVLRDITDSQFAFQVTLERIEVLICHLKFTTYYSKEMKVAATTLGPILTPNASYNGYLFPTVLHCSLRTIMDPWVCTARCTGHTRPLSTLEGRAERAESGLCGSIGIR
jgi:hypothetical protein